MSWVGFEPMTPVFERAKIVHASDRAATVIGNVKNQSSIFLLLFVFQITLGSEWEVDPL
jgi:hypothetical protein